MQNLNGTTAHSQYFYLKLRLSSLLVISILLIASCGGGGGSQKGGPEISYTVSNQRVFEEGFFVIDAWETPTTGVTMSQISGPTATKLSNVNVFATRWQAPSLELDITEIMEFELKAIDDDGNVSTEVVSVEVIGFSGLGRVIGQYSPSLQLYEANSFNQLYGVRNTLEPQFIDEQEIVLFGKDNYSFTDYRLSDTLTVAGTYRNISQLVTNALSFNLLGSRDFNKELLVLDEVNNTVNWLTSNSSISDNANLLEADSFSIEAPCSFLGRVDTGQNFVWVGQRDRGLSVVRLEPIIVDDVTTFETEVIDEIGSGRSLCHLMTTVFPEDIYIRDYYDDSAFSNLIAVDYNSNSLVLYGDTNEDRHYEELSVIPIQGATDERMKIVDVFSSGTASESPHYLAILMSDGEVDGKHSLTVIGQFDNNEFGQQVFSWTSGVPQSLVHGSFIGIRPGDQTRKDFAVVTKSPGQVLVFENIIPDWASMGETPVYSEPVSFDIEDGAGSAVTAYEDFILKTIEQGDVIYISYPDTGVVRSYTPSFEELNSFN